MSLTYSTADSVLKEDYKAPVRSQLNNANVLLAQLERNTDDVEGLRAYHPIHISRNTGVGARAELETLPTAGNQGYAEALVPLRFNYATIKLSGPVMRAMKSNRGSFIRALRSETVGAVNDLKRDVNRQTWGSANGTIAQCGTSTATTTITLAASTPASALRQLDEGMVIDIGTVASPTTVASARTVSSVDFSAKTFVISGANVTTSSSHYIFRSGAGGASSNSGVVGDGQRELTGMQAIVAASGVLHTVDPSTVGKWKSTVDSTGGSISEDAIIKISQSAEIKSGKTADFIVTTPGLHRTFASQLETMKRFPNSVELKGGYKGLDISWVGSGQESGKTVTLVWERDCPDGNVFGLSLEDLVQYEASDWEWMDQDGAVLYRTANVDAYEATLFKYHEIATYQRNAHWRLSGLTDAGVPA